MTVGDRIRQQREAKGITQLELARRIGYTTFVALKKGTAPKNCPITKEKRKMKKPN